MYRIVGGFQGKIQHFCEQGVFTIGHYVQLFEDISSKQLTRNFPTELFCYRGKFC